MLFSLSDQNGGGGGVTMATGQEIKEITSTIILNNVAVQCIKRDLNKAERVLVQVRQGLSLPKVAAAVLYFRRWENVQNVHYAE